MDVLLIGYGAIAQEVLKHIQPGEDANISAILVRPARIDDVRAAVADRGIEVVSSFDDLSSKPQLVAECAGHAGVRAYGVDALRRGMDFLVISIGVLADAELYDDLVQAAKDGGAKLVLAAGAVAGADALAAARIGGLDKVTYTSRKPPGAWKGTPAEEVCDLDALTEEATLYQGGADEAATRYPQNANVAATIALAGAGFAKTEVRLVADPAAGGNIHQVHAEGMFGAVDIEIRGKPLPDNPKTSTLAAHSVVAEIRRRAAPVEIGGLIMSEPIFIGGEWKPGRGPDMVSIYPADGTETAVVAGANAEDVDEAVARAKAAMAEPAWRDMKPHDRGGLLMRVSQLISERAEDLARLQMRDNGKPIGETRALVASAAGTFRYYGAVAETMEEEITPARGPYVSMSIYDPIGVVAVITPWNSPIASDAQKLAPALAAGCAVILKPAGVTPLVALELGRICEAAGIPKGIVSVLPGPGSVIGDALVTHPDIARVAFTGGTEVGRGIARQAAEKLMPVSLELGGKSPTIVFEDAQIDHAVNGVIFGIFSSSGESCIAGSRLFVHRNILDEFTDALVAKTAALRIGDPAAETTQMGPLVSTAHRDGIEKYVALGLEEGGEVLIGGARPEEAGYVNPAGGDFAYGGGSFYLPTIFTGLGNDARMVQEEIFGPVLAILPFDDEENLIAQANDTVFGLACGLWTEDYRRAWRLARRIDAGTMWINTYKLFSIATPFGGLKDSGTGREKGRQGIRQYQEQKSLYWGMNDAPLGWAD